MGKLLRDQDREYRKRVSAMLNAALSITVKEFRKRTNDNLLDMNITEFKNALRNNIAELCNQDKKKEGEYSDVDKIDGFIIVEDALGNMPNEPVAAQNITYIGRLRSAKSQVKRKTFTGFSWQ